MSVTKSKFIDRFAEKGKMKRAEAEREVNLFIDTLVDCILENGTVKLYGLGKFEVKTIKERIERNLQKGKEFKIPEHKKIKFSASKIISKMINEK